MIIKQKVFDDRTVSSDGRLTEPSDGIKYDVRAMLEKVTEPNKTALFRIMCNVIWHLCPKCNRIETLEVVE